MQVAVTGATGFVGRAVCARLVADGDEVMALTRNPEKAAKSLGAQVQCVPWEIPGDFSWKSTTAGADAIVHLAGESIGKRRWTDDVRKQLRASRIDTTRVLIDAISAGPSRTKCFVCASAVGYYGDVGEAVLTEESPRGAGFLAELCGEWEAEAMRASVAGIREVRLRLGVVLGRDGGALQQMLYPLPIHISPWKLGLGGPLGSGRQWVSWIDLTDLVEMIVWAIRDERVHGAVNAVAPNPVTNAELTRGIGTVLHRPAVLPVPAPILRLALGDFAETLLGGQRVLPEAAMKLGFTFSKLAILDSLRANIT